MKSENRYFKKKIYYIAASFIMLPLVSIALFSLFRSVGQNSLEPLPPDLIHCTRLEILCSQPILKLLSPLDDLGSDFFNDEQMEYLQTTKKFIIDNKNDIRQIARAVRSGTFKMGGAEEINYMQYSFNMSIIGYRKNERITTIEMYHRSFILDENNQRFNYNNSLPSLVLFVPENIRPSILRVFCAGKLWQFWENFALMGRSKKAYPIPAKWCDFIMQNKIEEKVFSKKQVINRFRCPSAGEGKCHYAMNPNCEPNSPGDMVLLFETKAGWNQSGGPELFTFDNHDPRGGCVLLNDGTVKFIRTEEELNQLRWK